MELTPDLTMVDLEMPTQNGIKLQKMGLTQPTPVNILTVSGDRRDVKAAIALSIAEYMLKPPDPEKLKRRITKCLNMAV